MSENFMYGDFATTEFNEMHETDATIVVDEVNIVNVLTEVFGIISKQKDKINNLLSKIDDLNAINAKLETENSKLQKQVSGLMKEIVNLKTMWQLGVIHKVETPDGFKQFPNLVYPSVSVKEYTNGPTFTSIGDPSNFS